MFICTVDAGKLTLVEKNGAKTCGDLTLFTHRLAAEHPPGSQGRWFPADPGHSCNKGHPTVSSAKSKFKIKIITYFVHSDAAWIVK